MIRFLLATLFGVICFTSAGQANDAMRLAVTTSFHNSGLADILLPEIENDLGITVQLLVVGTGQAIRMGQAGDVDAILVHSKSAEDAFVADGFGTHRREIMYNDFVIVGPADDPAQASTATTATEALTFVSNARADFVSRGDDSGTHKKEQDLWQATDITPDGGWYKSVGAGMGAALNTASALDAYILSDRASWLNFGNKDNLTVLFQGDPSLFNQYAYIPVNPDRHKHVNAKAASRLEAWLSGNQSRALINAYTIDGETLFTHNARPMN